VPSARRFRRHACAGARHDGGVGGGRLDRVAIGVTRPYIARDLGLTPTQMGYVFSAFYLSYALFEIPTGWWGDKVGTRKVLTRIVCWWSAFTVLTGFGIHYSSLLVIRFLFGAGEAGAWPNVARTFSRGFPRRDRGTVQGTFFMGAHLAGGLTPLIATALLAYMDWRTMFAVFGSVGFIWALAWYRWFRDTPPSTRRWMRLERAFIKTASSARAAARETQWKTLPQDGHLSLPDESSRRPSAATMSPGCRHTSTREACRSPPRRSV
jgi:MFS family permease